jgi:hypothetical protein
MDPGQVAEGLEDAVVDVVQKQAHGDALRKRNDCGKGVANKELKKIRH